jgi:hypothetical protein
MSSYIHHVFERALWKVTCGELLTEQATRKIFLLYTRNMYILKLRLNVFTAGIEALVITVNKFLHACVKEICHL